MDFQKDSKHVLFKSIKINVPFSIAQAEPKGLGTAKPQGVKI